MADRTTAVTPLPPAEAPARRGPRYTFTIPKGVRVDADPKSVTMVALTLAQDMDGNKVAEKTKNPFEKAKMAIVAIDGRPVDWATGQIDDVIDKASPKVRELLLAAYLEIHAPSKEVVEDFLGSLKIDT